MSGLTRIAVRSAPELRAAFDRGRAARRKGTGDLAADKERAAAIFTVALAQYMPAPVPGEEDRVLVGDPRVVGAGPLEALHGMMGSALHCQRLRQMHTVSCTALLLSI